MAAISFKKINRAALAERRVHKKLTMITIILYAVAAVLFAFTSDGYGVSTLDGDRGFYYFQPSLWGAFFAILGVIVGYITALNMFRDMNNQQICDVTMALPIKSEERFFSKLTAIVYIQIIPQFIAVFGGCGISILISTIACRGIKAEVIQKFFAVVLMFLAASMFMISIAVLCVCCCGSFAESIYFSLILMVIINALPIVFSFRIFDQCSGIDWISSHQNMFSYWGFMFLLRDDFGNGYSGLILSCAVGILISAAVSLVMIFVYRKRDARSVGNPISSRVFFELIMFLGVITIYTAFIMSDAVFWGLLIAAVIYVIINIIVSRAKINFFSFLKWGAKFTATTLVFVAVLIPAIKTGGFGFINTRPSAEELEGSSIRISYDDWEERTDEDGYSYFYCNHPELRTETLTKEQAVQIIDIYKKHLTRGRAAVNPINIITTYTFFENISDATITVTGKDLDEKPKGIFIGYDYRESYHDYGLNEDQSDRILKPKYNLYFNQRLEISQEEARELAKELKQLDFVHEVKPVYYGTYA